MTKKIKPIKAWAIINTKNGYFTAGNVFSTLHKADEVLTDFFVGGDFQIVPVLITPIKPAKRART